MRFWGLSYGMVCHNSGKGKHQNDDFSSSIFRIY